LCNFNVYLRNDFLVTLWTFLLLHLHENLGIFNIFPKFFTSFFLFNYLSMQLHKKKNCWFQHCFNFMMNKLILCQTHFNLWVFNL
jgi:hypothetical protein